jgi:hypothetical protein
MPLKVMVPVNHYSHLPSPAYSPVSYGVTMVPDCNYPELPSPVGSPVSCSSGQAWQNCAPQQWFDAYIADHAPPTDIQLDHISSDLNSPTESTLVEDNEILEPNNNVRPYFNMYIPVPKKRGRGKGKNPRNCRCFCGSTVTRKHDLKRHHLIHIKQIGEFEAKRAQAKADEYLLNK